MYGGDGALLTLTRDVVDRWKEYFEDLLNSIDTPSGKEAGPGDSGGGVVWRWSKSSLVAGPWGWMRSARSSLRPVDVVGLSCLR